MDRASGSGVFARDPDALIDLTELEITDDLLKQEENKAVAGTIAEYIYKVNKVYYDEEVSQDDILSQSAMKDHAKEALNESEQKDLDEKLSKIIQKVKQKTAWRVEGTLREFPRFEPINLWFDYPVHKVDTINVLKDIQPESDKPSWQKAKDKRKSKDTKKEERINALEIAFSSLEIGGEQITVRDLA